MAVRYKHSDTYTTYFCTFTCYSWINLFLITDSYDLVYDWFKIIKDKYDAEVLAYVIMPNHLHCILYFRNAGFDLNKIISNGKRFMAYKIVARLENSCEETILNKLSGEITEREKKKGQKHRVFENSFDAKAIFSDEFLFQKIDYIHHNPVKGKWKLAENYTDYVHSSASFYDSSIIKHFKPLHCREV